MSIFARRKHANSTHSDRISYESSSLLKDESEEFSLPSKNVRQYDVGTALDSISGSKKSGLGKLFDSFSGGGQSNRHDSMRSDNSDYEIVAVKDSKVYKKYRLTNFWAVVILSSVAIDCNYLQLPFPYKLSPITVISFIVYSALAGLVSSYFV
jgi:hypothetical protein